MNEGEILEVVMAGSVPRYASLFLSFLRRVFPPRPFCLRSTYPPVFSLPARHTWGAGGPEEREEKEKYETWWSNSSAEMADRLVFQSHYF